MATINLKARSGNRVVVQFDGKQVGLLQSVRANDDYHPVPASGVGDIHVQEYVPSMAGYQISVSSMILFKQNLRAAGITALNGDEALRGNVFDIAVFSKDDGSELRKYTGCSFSSGDVEVNKHAILLSNAQFNALDVTGTGL